MKLNSRTRSIKRERTVSDMLPFVRHISNHVVALRGGRMLCVIELEGASFETADVEDLNALHTKLNLLWRSNNDERLALWTHTIRTRDRNYPDGTFRSDFARQLDTKYRAKITGERLFRNRLFLSLVWVPARDKDGVRAFGARLRKARKAGTELNQRALQDFEGVIQNIVIGLSRYEARALDLYEHDGLIFSEAMEFLNAIGTLSFDRMPLVDGPISGAIMKDRPLFGREVIELRGAGNSRYAGIFGVKEYPASTKPGMMDDLLRAPFECMLTQSFGMLSKTDGRAILSRKQNQMISVGDRALSQIDDLDAAIDDLESNRFTMGRHHMSLMVLAPTSEVLMENMANASRILSDCGIVGAREDLALEQQFWGQWPGNFEKRGRSGHLNSKNFAALAPFHSYPKGKPTCEWGPSVALLKTASGCAFHFNFHYGDLGNTFICGPSGSGKTVVQNFMLAQLQKHDATMVFFDKDRGAEIFVRAAGGVYLMLRNGEPTGCAPLKALDLEDDSERTFAIQWVAKLVERPDQPMSVADQRQVERGIDQMRRLPRQQRTLNSLRAFFSQRDPEGIGARLERWIDGSVNGWAFDNDHDKLALDAKFLGFDMTEFLDNTEIRTPLMMYLFYRIEKLIDGRRIVIDVDEFWKALGDEAFRGLAQNKLKTIRKQNGLMVFGTQSPRDAIQSEIGYTIIEQCPTQIFMPNERGSRNDYVDGFGLSEREFQLIKSELSLESRQFLVKQGHNSVVVELALDGFDDELTVLSGREPTIQKLDRIRAEVGDDPAAWMPLLLCKEPYHQEAAE